MGQAFQPAFFLEDVSYSIIRVLTNKFCQLLMDWINGTKRSKSYVRHTFETAVSSSIGCIGGLAQEGDIKAKVTSGVTSAAMAAWNKALGAWE